MNPTNLLNVNTGLVVVDMQNDFCPGGALPIENGNVVVQILNPWIREGAKSGSRLYFSRDWHPKRHMSFESEGGKWPPHCIQDTKGAEFHPDLQIPDSSLVVTKGVRLDKDQNSVFDETGFTAQLKRDGVETLIIGGLAQDVCVKATVIDALNAGFETILLLAATRPVTKESGEQAVEEMRQAGATIKED